GFDAVGILQLALAIALLAAVIFILSGRSFSLPFGRFIAGHADLLPLMSLAFCFGAAALAGIAGLTPAYGAFLAGLVIGASREREATIERTRPIQSILMMVFFVSIGLLINPALIWDNLGLVVTLLLLIILFKTAFNVLITRALGEPWPSAFLSGLVLAQIGEFSFLLAAAGVGAGLITGEDGDLVVAVAALSLLFGPAWLAVARRLHLPALQSVRSSLEMFRLLYESNTLNSRVITDMTRRAVRRGKTRRSTRRSRRGPRPDA
ncbi:MAG: cation:proton antiporter, partial [Alphaproteobacteria bacterium]